MVLLLDAPVFSLSLSQTSSDIRFGGQEPSSHVHRHRRLLTEKRIFSLAYYYRVGTSGITHWKTILFQLVYGSTIYRSVCLFLYIKLQLEL